MGTTDAALIRQWRATREARSTPIRQWVRRRVGADWRPARHLETLYDLFERAARESVFALVSMPPGSGKTTTLLACLSWLMLRTPAEVHGYVSYSQSIARSKSTLLRDWCVDGGWERHRELWAAHDWRSACRGGLLASGVGGRLTGDRITGTLVVDDPFKGIADASSLVMRERVSAWFDAVAWTRLFGPASLIVVHTRWDRDDLIGRLRRVVDHNGRPVWEEHRLAAIDDKGRSYWPEAYPIDVLRRTKAQLDASNPHLWPALYLQQPVPKGGRLFSGEPARYMTRDLSGGVVTLGADFAATAKKRADHSALAHLVTRGRGPEAVSDVLDIVRWQAESPVTLARIAAYQENLGPTVPVAWETAGVGEPMRQHYVASYPGRRVVLVTRSSDKYTAAIPTATAFNAGRVRYPLAAPWLAAHFERLRAFTGLEGGDDDDVDALVNGRSAATLATTSSGRITL